MARVPITEEEKKSPYYKYFLREITQPSAEVLEVFCNNPLTPENALTPEEINRLFEPGHLPCERGWTRLKNGVLMIANRIEMPGVTIEMFDWWFAWHGLEPMRYKIWDPEDHYHCLTRNPEISRDASLPMKKRYQNTVHDVVEDVGGSKSKVAINFRDPADIGFDREKLKDFDGSIVCAADEKGPVIMCHFARPIEGGIELRSHFWAGYGVKNSKPVKIKFPPPRLFPSKMAIGLLQHNIKEFTHLAAILPEVYAEFHDKF